MSRREMIRLTGGAALSAAVLAACGGDDGGGSGTGLRIASPSDPATLPIPDDNAPIESGLEPEAGPLKIYNWDEYIWPKVVKEFAAEHGVDFEISTFYNMNEAVAKIKTGQVDFDVFFPTIDVVPKLAAAKLIQPLNHSYIPNLDKNVWPELADPWYDKGSRYTVPYTVYTTGIAWRTDMVDDDIAALDNPYDIFWDPRYRGKVGIYDSYRDAMNMVLLRNGITDINTDDPKDIELVKRDLVDMADKTSVRTTINGAYAKLPEGDFAIHQSWSGDIVAAPYYFPESNYGDPKGLLRFWWPENGKGEIGNDTIAIPKAAKNPVLAHLFLDFMLQNQEAIDNFSWVGYQPPIKAIDPDKLVKQQYVVPNLKEAIVRKEYFDSGYKALTLPPDVDAMWQDAWSDFKSGA
ncbi:MAG TPA: spermidine/putrescine ABC transporter substrate-binding protein [Actinomycetota bacterium]|nr:spermidine/putrescine ABC transporter substrate-binding protein [Actinomycetota bacterium]